MPLWWNNYVALYKTLKLALNINYMHIIYTRTHARTHVRTHAHTYVRTYVRTHAHTYTHTHMHTLSHTLAHTRARSRTPTRTPAHTFMACFAECLLHANGIECNACLQSCYSFHSFFYTQNTLVLVKHVMPYAI